MCSLVLIPEPFASEALLCLPYLFTEYLLSEVCCVMYRTEAMLGVLSGR